MMALAGVELETLVSEPDALTTRPPPCQTFRFQKFMPNTWTARAVNNKKCELKQTSSRDFE